MKSYKSIQNFIKGLKIFDTVMMNFRGHYGKKNSHGKLLQFCKFISIYSNYVIALYVTCIIYKYYIIILV